MRLSVVLPLVTDTSDIGYVSSKAIFAHCGGQVDYPMIKLCGMFI